MPRFRSAVAALALGATLTVPAAADARGATVTRGEFHTTAAGAALGYDIGGHATMVRTAAGTTIVMSHPTGLTPGVTYGSHVHNAPCETGGGGHYQHVVGGAVDDVNELWPIVSGNPAGNATGRATHAHTARPEAQSIVIHQPGTGARIACLDFS